MVSKRPGEEEEEKRTRGNLWKIMNTCEGERKGKKRRKV